MTTEVAGQKRSSRYNPPVEGGLTERQDHSHPQADWFLSAGGDRRWASQ